MEAIICYRWLGGLGTKPNFQETRSSCFTRRVSINRTVTLYLRASFNIRSTQWQELVHVISFGS